jgi:hypothetical protein
MDKTLNSKLSIDFIKKIFEKKISHQEIELVKELRDKKVDYR